jgi:predicted TIM-barrel fold metal-dependent hydrolase
VGNKGRIDVHHHVVPPAYSEWLRANGQEAGGLPIPSWSEDAAISLMDDHEIETSVLSISTPGVHLGDDIEARRMARVVNEFAADIVGRRPDRFGFFATLTAPDVEGSIAEATYALDYLKAEGVVLLANTHGEYLGAPELDPLFAELDRRAAVVFVHPSVLPGSGVPGLPAFAIDFLLDTTRAATNMVRNGMVQRYPNLKIILAHAGGFVPYAAERIAMTLSFTTQRPLTDILADLRSFYFDTALSTPTALPSLLAFAQPGHVLFGSDWPYAPSAVVGLFTGELDKYELSAMEQTAIARESAAAILPRLAQGIGDKDAA